MRVLIDQQFHLGHHYQYLAHLLPALTPLVDEVVVATTREGQTSDQFQSLLAPFSTQVRFEPILPAASPWMPMGERWRLHRDLRRVVRQLAPDYVLLPSGDGQSTAMGLFRVVGLGAVPGGRPCEVGIHFGSGRAAVGRSARVRDVLNRLNLSTASVRRVHLVNLLFYEDVRAHHPRDGRFVLMPHPVPHNPRLSRIESRRALGVPEEGRYIGLAASIDSRKAVYEFLTSFRKASRPNERLLLAGWIAPSHLQKLEESFSDLRAAGKVILIKGFLEPAVFQTVLTALDVVCTPYPQFAGLSSTLLEGVAAGRPILANDFGWSKVIIERFGVGWTCDVTNPDSFATTLRTALDHCDEYQESEATRRLLAFHAPENFAQSWVRGIRETLGHPPVPLRSWDWVTETLESRPARH
jgi:glycosyltransferase involved in cell wall biosynthesis